MTSGDRRRRVYCLNSVLTTLPQTVGHMGDTIRKRAATRANQHYQRDVKRILHFHSPTFRSLCKFLKIMGHSKVFKKMNVWKWYRLKAGRKLNIAGDEAKTLEEVVVVVVKDGERWSTRISNLMYADDAVLHACNEWKLGRLYQSLKVVCESMFEGKCRQEKAERGKGGGIQYVMCWWIKILEFEMEEETKYLRLTLG